MRTTVDRFGRVVVPKSMRERIGLRAGTAVEIEESEGHITLWPIEEASPLVLKDGVLVFTGTAVGELEAVVAKNREERVRRLAGVPWR